MRRLTNLSSLLAVLLLAAASSLEAQTDGADDWHAVVSIDASRSPEEPHLVEGSIWHYGLDEIPVERVPENDPTRSVFFGPCVRFTFDGLRADARLRLRAVFLSADGQRRQRLLLDDGILDETFDLPDDEKIVREWDVPKDALADGQLDLAFLQVRGPNAVVSRVELRSATADVWAGLASRPLRLTPEPLSVDGVATPSLSLAGDWWFHSAPPRGFQSADPRRDDGWAKIRVPGEWAMQGFHLPGDRTVGYWREFAAPADWGGRVAILRCDAIYGRASIWVNGRFAGRSERTMTPFELDIGDHLKTGELNTIAVAVTNAGLADDITYGTGYARHPLGGIVRGIRIVALPRVHLIRFHVETDLDPDYRDATLRLLLRVMNGGGAPATGLTLHAELTDPDGKRVATHRFEVPPLAAGGEQSLDPEVSVTAPALWHCEHPTLHRLRLELRREGQVLETVARRIGFREVEVRGTEVLVNGRAVKLRGVNRHEAHPLLGRSLRAPLWRRDASLFKACNVNLVRTSHYPPDEAFLDACDELGLFVEVESPVTWVGHGAAASVWKERRDPTSRRLLPYLRDFLLETIERDRSHPSVIMWSMANESTWSPLWEEVLEAGRAADPTRPLVFHDQCWGGYNLLGSRADIANMHYPGPGGVAEAESRVEEMGNRPVYFGEYCHLNVYNRQELEWDPGIRADWGAHLLRMWETIQGSEVVIGGSIWSGIDDRFSYGGQWVGYGSWGPIDGWRRRKPEAWFVQKAYSPVRVPRTSFQLPDRGAPLVIPVENRMTSTNLATLTVEWSSKEESGTTTADVPPATRGQISIAPRRPWQDGQRVDLRFRHADGRLVDAYRLTLGEARGSDPERPALAHPVELSENEATWTARAAGFRWTLERATGAIRCETRDGRALLQSARGPWLSVRSAQTSTWIETRVRGTLEARNHWHDFRVTSAEARREGSDVVLALKGAARDLEGELTLHVHRDGSADVRHHWRYDGPALDVQELGLLLELPRTLQRMSWQRSGLLSWYPEEHISRLEGTTTAFRPDHWPALEPDQEPPWPWRLDSDATGTHDFRASRRGIHFLRLDDARGHGIEVRSPGHHATRCWVADDRIRLLVLESLGEGSERFLRSHQRGRRILLEPGDRIEGSFILRPLTPKGR